MTSLLLIESYSTSFITRPLLASKLNSELLVSGSVVSTTSSSISGISMNGLVDPQAANRATSDNGSAERLNIENCLSDRGV